MSQKQRLVNSSQHTSDTRPLLIVDADAATLAHLHQSLTRANYLILLSDSGDDALDQIQEHRPQLLIIGDQLVDTSGNDICRQIKGDDRLGFMPIILLNDSGDLPSDDHPWYADVVLSRTTDSAALIEWIQFLLRIRSQFERLTRENERLLAASQSIELLKQEIIANVSHELRTPLVQVKAAVALLVEDFRQDDSREQTTTTVGDMAQQAVARLESVVENIRQLAQSHDVRLAPVNVREAADLALRFVERSWISRNASGRIETQIPANLPMIEADKRALARLLQLLLDNAVKFSEPDSAIHLLARLDSHQQVWIGVRDHGIGIAPHEHHRVFDAFYQVDGSTTRRYGGTGSGLALAGLLARSMNTSIHIDSTPGKGSTFSLVFPAADPEDFDIT